MQYKKLSNYSKYLFSEDGNIYRIRKDHLQRLKLSKHPSGYTYKNLYDDSGRQKTFRVHRLIAKLFIDNPLNKPYVNHKNGKKDDNVRICPPYNFDLSSDVKKGNNHNRNEPTVL